MKCNKCKKENIVSSSYCKYCGNKFSEEEKKTARRKTFIGKIEMMEKTYKICTLQKITGHILFKIASVIGVLIIGLLFLFNYGSDLKILNSISYDLSYNEEEKEYYIVTDKDEVLLNLYIPNSIDDIKVSRVENEKVIEVKEYSKGDEILLYTNLENDYYLLEAKDSKLKLFVYGGEINE